MTPLGSCGTWSGFWALLAQIGIVLAALVLAFIVVGVVVHLFNRDA